MRLRSRRFRHPSVRFKFWRIKLASNLSSSLLFLIPVLFVAVFILFIWYSRDLPQPDKIKRKVGFSTVILDRNEKPIYDIYEDQNRIPITLSQVPDFLKKATISIEDKNFYSHQGFDTLGILRSIFRIITLRGLQGGSTLTQQLVKNVLLTQEQTIPRKIKEFILAVQIEKKYSKDEILQMYLNEAPYGGTMWGIESAAQGYFGKKTEDLSFLEAVILAGLPQRPSFYSPFGSNPKSYISRSEEVLRRLREDNYISAVAEAEYKRDLRSVKFISKEERFKAPHFVLYVKKILEEQFGDKLPEGKGYRITTTLDLDLQTTAEEIVEEELEKLKGLKVSNGASLIINPLTGEILSYIGSKAYYSQDENFQGKFDVLSMGYRQPGSALKPITYAVAFNKGYTPAYLLMDVETRFPGGETQKDYIPRNYDGKFRGPVQLRFALGNSINVPAVKLSALVGVKEILKLAYEMGIASLEPTDENVRNLGLSITLGGGEVSLLDLTYAYGVFASKGVRQQPVMILKITDSSGQVIYENKPGSGKKVLNENTSFLINDILADNNARKDVFGLNSYLNIPGRTIAVKTGTTDDKRDNWAIGYSRDVVVGVWVGNNDNSPMDAKLASGVTGASPIWNRLIKEALKNKKDSPFDRPEQILEREIDSYSGGLPYQGKPSRKEIFIKGTEPESLSAIYSKIKLSKSDNNQLANVIEVATGSYVEKEFIIFRENDPTGGKDGKNLWQEGINEWIKTQSDPIFHPPNDTSSSDADKVVVRVKTPENNSQIDNNSFSVEAEAKSVLPIDRMEIYINDNLKTTVKGNELNESFTLDNGVYELKIKAFAKNQNSGETQIKFGIKTSPNSNPALTSLPFSPSPAISPSVMISPT